MIASIPQHILSLSLFPLCGIIHPHTSSPLFPLSIIPSTHQPGRVYLMTQAISFFCFFFLSPARATSQPGRT